ncbi:heavy-metal-associated domain-containing protein [uncultured Paracoccus sp.]|uniref:heavy-metal-associated domain-containing protein n=1 Tax=uncultured Paracoccus sp. TaxID=189685 RepID=UPI0025F635DD|nr:heavy-metal-associated domain-containing protein [uncultured Paracoccus sp.]
MRFHVPDMACGGCAQSITRAIALLDPQASVQADTATRTITVETTAPESEVVKALDAAGYPATAG